MRNTLTSCVESLTQTLAQSSPGSLSVSIEVDLQSEAVSEPDVAPDIDCSSCSGGATVAELTGKDAPAEETPADGSGGTTPSQGFSHSFIPPQPQRFRTDRNDAMKAFDVSGALIGTFRGNEAPDEPDGSPQPTYLEETGVTVGVSDGNSHNHWCVQIRFRWTPRIHWFLVPNFPCAPSYPMCRGNYFSYFYVSWCDQVFNDILLPIKM